MGLVFLEQMCYDTTVRHREGGLRVGVIKGNLEATITLGKNSCYFMRTGKCSLGLVGDFFLSGGAKIGQADLLYCPRLYRQMCGSDKNKPVEIVPCECGHAEVVSGHQRACIASQKRLEVLVQATGDEVRALCPVCGRQMTFEEEEAANQGGTRIVTLRARVKKEPARTEK